MSNISLQPQTVLSTSNLFFAYRDNGKSNQVINNLSLTVKAGELVCILGASGCGKSTLLNLISGLLVPTSGKIEFVNPEISTKKNDRQQIGYIFQVDALFPWRTVESNLLLATEIFKDISKASVRDLISKYLQTFHLSEDILKRYPSQLSGGMRQRISIMQTLMFNPNLLLLDEPFAALDFFTKLRLESELYQLIKEQNKAAILITHDIDEAIALADRVLIMANGVITNEFKIDFADSNRSPEDIRGTAKFAEYYHTIWSQLKTIIQA